MKDVEETCENCKWFEVARPRPANRDIDEGYCTVHGVDPLFGGYPEVVGTDCCGRFSPKHSRCCKYCPYAKEQFEVVFK